MSQGGGHVFAVEGRKCGLAAGAGIYQQSLGWHHSAVEPVDLSAATNAADDPNFASDDLRMNVCDEVLDQPERVGHFRDSHSQAPHPKTYHRLIWSPFCLIGNTISSCAGSTFGCGCGKATTRPSSARWSTLEQPIGQRCCLNHHGSIRRGSATTSSRRSVRSAERTRPQLQSIGVSS